MRLERKLGKCQLNRIEVRTVLRQKPELRADGFDRSSHRGALGHERLSMMTMSPGASVWRQDLLDVGDRPSRSGAEVPVFGLLPDPPRVDRSRRRHAPIARPENVATPRLSTGLAHQEDG